MGAEDWNAAAHLTNPYAQPRWLPRPGRLSPSEVEAEIKDVAVRSNGEAGLS